MFERLTRWENNDKDVADLIEEKSDFDGLTEAVNRLAAYEDSGLSPEEVQELAKAKADGRLVVLPIKVGESVYAIVNCADIIKSCDDDYFTGTGAISCPFEKDCPFEECDDGNRGVFETACKGFWVDDGGRLNVFLDYINANIGPLDFGKTVFLTREAAEKAVGVGE
jgi:hypothetical protein